jgi:MFS family permease
MFIKFNVISIFVLLKGVTSISSNLDPYLMYLLSSIAEVIGYISCHLNDKFSRKRVMIFFLGTAGIMCLIVALIPKDVSSDLSVNSILVILFASIGKAMASAAFNSGYVFTSKLYPVNVRNTLVSLVLSVGRIGSLISPQINLLKTLVWAPLPYLIFSFSSLIASFTMIFVPNPSNTD